MNLEELPTVAPVAVYLRPGDILLQPAGVLHAPYSPTNVWMRGSMHWDSRDLERILQLSLLQAQHTAITNEPCAKDFFPIMQWCMVGWKRSSPECQSEWPEKEKLRGLSNIFDVRLISGLVFALFD